MTHAWRQKAWVFIEKKPSRSWQIEQNTHARKFTVFSLKLDRHALHEIVQSIKQNLPSVNDSLLKSVSLGEEWARPKSSLESCSSFCLMVSPHVNLTNDAIELLQIWFRSIQFPQALSRNPIKFSCFVLSVFCNLKCSKCNHHAAQIKTFFSPSFIDQYFLMTKPRKYVEPSHKC